MRAFTLTQANRAARNAGSIARADDGAGNATIKVYDAEGGTLLATRTLADPCGTVRAADGRLQLAAATTTDLVAVTGAAAWAEWVAADGTVLAAGKVTDESGFVSTSGGGTTDTGDIGPWVLAGTTGTMIYAGGVLVLDSVVMG